MTDASLISLFVRPLNQLRIPYIVTGGVASVLRPELAQALGPDRFLREIEIAARLNHPHILTLIDSGAVLKAPEQAPEAGVSFQPYLWPEYEPYHSDPRFRAVLEKFSLPLPSTTAGKESTP